MKYEVKNSATAVDLVEEEADEKIDLKRKRTREKFLCEPFRHRIVQIGRVIDR